MQVSMSIQTLERCYVQFLKIPVCVDTRIIKFCDSNLCQKWFLQILREFQIIETPDSRDDEIWEENEVVGKSEVADFPVKIMQAI